LTSNLLSPDAELDACADYDCGRGGECVPMNGSPSCRCGVLGSRVDRVRSDGTTGAVCETFHPPEFVSGPPVQTPPAAPGSGIGSPPVADAASVEDDAGAQPRPALAGDSNLSLCHATPRRTPPPLLALALGLALLGWRSLRRASSARKQR
jgi:hypothetical protein